MQARVRVMGAAASIAAGLLGVVVVLRAPARASVPTALAYMAMQAIPGGTQIEPGIVRAYNIPVVALSSTTISPDRGFGPPYGDYATTNIPAYSFLYRGAVSGKGQWVNGIPPHMEAVSIPVVQQSLAGVSAGEWVTLYVEASAGAAQRQTVVVAPSVRILDLYDSNLQLVGAVGQSGLPATSQGTEQPTIARIAVTPAQAASLAQAAGANESIYIVQGAAPAKSAPSGKTAAVSGVRTAAAGTSAVTSKTAKGASSKADAKATNRGGRGSPATHNGTDLTTKRSGTRGGR